MNKLILELELPTECSDAEQTAAFLQDQANVAVKVLRDALTFYKDKGVTVPAISVRSNIKAESVGLELKHFRTTLLDHLLKYQPNVAIPPQMKVIRELYSLDSNASNWLEMFEDSRKEYALTTWHTVKYKLGKKEVKQTSDFERKELSGEEISNLVERLKEYNPD